MIQNVRRIGDVHGVILCANDSSLRSASLLQSRRPLKVVAVTPPPRGFAEGAVILELREAAGGAQSCTAGVRGRIWRCWVATMLVMRSRLSRSEARSSTACRWCARRGSASRVKYSALFIMDVNRRPDWTPIGVATI